MSLAVTAAVFVLATIAATAEASAVDTAKPRSGDIIQSVVAMKRINGKLPVRGPPLSSDTAFASVGPDPSCFSLSLCLP